MRSFIQLGEVDAGTRRVSTDIMLLFIRGMVKDVGFGTTFKV
jgi:hypothetical protein